MLDDNAQNNASVIEKKKSRRLKSRVSGTVNTMRMYELRIGIPQNRSNRYYDDESLTDLQTQCGKGAVGVKWVFYFLGTPAGHAPGRTPVSNTFYRTIANGDEKTQAGTASRMMLSAN